MIIKGATIRIENKGVIIRNNNKVYTNKGAIIKNNNK